MRLKRNILLFLEMQVTRKIFTRATANFFLTAFFFVEKQRILPFIVRRVFEEFEELFVCINLLVENHLNGELYRPSILNLWIYNSIINVNFTRQVSKFTACQHIFKTLMNLASPKQKYTCSSMKEKPLELSRCFFPHLGGLNMIFSDRSNILAG